MEYQTLIHATVLAINQETIAQRLYGGTGGWEPIPNCDLVEANDLKGEITSIYSYAFANFTKLEMASFPKCTYIGYSAFISCPNFISLYLMAPTVCSLATAAGGIFYSSPIIRTGTFYVPASLLSAYMASSPWIGVSSRFVGI